MKYGKLTVIDETGINWICKCDCGKEHTASRGNILNGHTKSCGCLRREIASQKFTKHGLRHHPLFATWQNMKNRCYNKNVSEYRNYGGRGITICDEWRNDFKAFYDWAIANGWAKGLEIDRFPDKNGNYESINCRFVTSQENNRNRRDTKLTIEKANEIRALYSNGHIVSSLAKQFNVHSKSIYGIIKNESWKTQ